MAMTDDQKITDNLKYLKLLSSQYPTIQSASSEIINLEAILDLPKGTEHFMSDLHGEHEAFTHILHNASGVIREKIDAVYGHADLLSRAEAKRDQAEKPRFKRVVPHHAAPFD